MSKNGGKSWKDITGKLPDAPVNDVFPKGKALYVATDVGVFVTKNNGRRWLRVGKALPMAPITDITLHQEVEQLVRIYVRPRHVQRQTAEGFLARASLIRNVLVPQGHSC